MELVNFYWNALRKHFEAVQLTTGFWGLTQEQRRAKLMLMSQVASELSIALERAANHGAGYHS
jgi:hypothetical protein